MGVSLLVACVRVPKNWAKLDYSDAIAAIAYENIPEGWYEDETLDEMWVELLEENNVLGNPGEDDSLGSLGAGEEYQAACIKCAQRHITNDLLPHLLKQHANYHREFPALMWQKDLPFDLLVMGGATWGDPVEFMDVLLYLDNLGIWDYHIPKFEVAAELSRTTGRVEYAVLDVDGTWATEVHDVPNDVTTMDALSTWPHDNLDKIATLRGRYNDIAGFAVLDSDSSEESEE